MIRRTVLLGPGLLYLALLLVVPCGMIFMYSLFERGTYGGIDYTLTSDNYERAFGKIYFSVFLDSLGHGKEGRG